MSERSEQFLAHYGVPGMKWGKRKAEAVAKTALEESHKNWRSSPQYRRNVVKAFIANQLSLGLIGTINPTSEGYASLAAKATGIGTAEAVSRKADQANYKVAKANYEKRKSKK